MNGQNPKKRIVKIGSKALEGILRQPKGSSGLVIFAHGAGSSRLSPRNNYVAKELGMLGIATLLFDLLTEEEVIDRNNVFDIRLLSQRLTEAVEWAQVEPGLSGLPIGLFGASTGAAAALVAAADAPSGIRAVVSRGGRADMAGEALKMVKAPVLLIVGSLDYTVIDLNRAAAEKLVCKHRLEIVPGATHLFEEPGTLEKVVELAGDWFQTHFQSQGSTQ